jgi:hypothetical protein
MKIYFTLKNGFVDSYNFTPTFEYTNEKEITVEEEELFVRHFPFIKYINGKFVFDKNEENKVVVKQNIILEQQEILKWLSDHDWIVNKVFLGEWTKEDPRWLSYLQERQVKRNRLEEIGDV